MAFNMSKMRDPRSWAKVRMSGGIGTFESARRNQEMGKIADAHMAFIETLRKGGRSDVRPYTDLVGLGRLIRLGKTPGAKQPTKSAIKTLLSQYKEN